jgi:hypothetical protein
MFRVQRALPLLIAVVSIGTTACVSGGYSRYPSRYPYPNVRSTDDRAYSIGFDEGRNRGESDARSGRRFDYSRHGSYRNADAGYRGYGDRSSYRELYRRGFVDGYNDGFRRYDRQGYSYPAPRVGGYPRTHPRNYPQGYPVSGAYSPAAQNGYRDGYDQGREDARDRDRFDPVRASRYRSGDRGYNNRYGSREDYKREYRAGFQQGYEAGYRDGRMSESKDVRK